MSRRVDGITSFLVPALVVSTIVEFITSRLLLKVGLPLPAFLASTQVDSLISFIGSFALQLTFLMVLFVIALSAYLLQQNSGVKHLSLAVLLIALVQVAVIHEYLRFDIVANFAYPFIFIVVVSSILLLVAPTGSLIEKLLATVFGGAYLTSYLSKSPAILQLIEFDFNAASSEVFQLGEFLAVAGAPLIYLVFRREISATSWRSFFVPSLLAGLFVTAYLLNPWATSTLAMLTLGFSLILPFPIYTIALWLYSFVTLGLLGKRKHVAYGLLLILLAGRNLQSTYLALIAITGLLFTFLPRQKIMPQVSVSTR